MNKFNEVQNHTLPKVEKGEAKSIEEFYEKTIKFQFENIDEIKKIHNALLGYIKLNEPTYFIRLYGSYPKKNYSLLRRGFVTQYADNTRISFCDNTFTLLFTAMKLSKLHFDSEDLKQLFKQEKLVVGFGQVSEEKELCFYSPKGAKRANLNEKGWYQAHIKPTGYNYENFKLTELFPNPDRTVYANDQNINICNENLSTDQLRVVQAHFLRLIHPFNSFLVPKKNHLEYEGKNIGEEAELIQFVRNKIIETFPQEYKEFDELSIKHEFDISNKSIETIKWFDKPKKSSLTEEKTKKNAKGKKTKTITPKDDSNKDIKLENTLQSIGKEVFAEILYPEIAKNADIHHTEIAAKYEKYKAFTEKAQQNRLSSARTIFRNGQEIEALINILESKKINDAIKHKIEEILNNYNK